MRLIDPESAQLVLEEVREAAPVLPVELLQFLDLPLQPFPPGGQTPHYVVIALLGPLQEVISVRACVSVHVGRPVPGISQNVLGPLLKLVRVSLGVLGDLPSLGVRLGECLVGFLVYGVGACLSLSDDLLCRRTRVRVNRLGGTPGTRDMLLSRPLGQTEHVDRLVLRRFRTGASLPLSWSLSWSHGLISRRRTAEQSFDTNLHPVIGHQ